MNSHALQSSTLPPAQPVYVLRGHASQIHALQFLRSNTRMLSGDAEGWIVLWNMSTKRPVAVWRAHNQSILGICDWSDDRIITHGRDGKINVWQLGENDVDHLSKTLPIDDGLTERRAPWLLHSLHVHALSFCSFSRCILPSIAGEIALKEDSSHQSLLLAVPGLVDGSINVEKLPSETRLATIPPPNDIKVGMTMALHVSVTNDNSLIISAGYESGHAAVWKSRPNSAVQLTYLEKAHSQPILSLDVALEIGHFFTSSADAVISRHPFDSNEGSIKTMQTKHAGQQSLQIRNDRKIFATAGWDGRARVFSVKTMKELAVLKWHKEGCYALAFATVMQTGHEPEGDEAKSVAYRQCAVDNTAHLIALGSKDGKISLWDIY